MVTRYHPTERYPEGKYPNRSAHDTGLGQYAKDDESLTNHDDVVWITTGTTHVARAEEWPIMPTEWAHAARRGTSLTKPYSGRKEKVILTSGEIQQDLTASSRLAGGGNRRPPVVQRYTLGRRLEVVGRRCQISSNAARHAATLSVGSASRR